MDVIEKLSIERECLHLISDYCTLWDSRNINSWLDLYHADMTFEAAGTPPVEGLEKLRASLIKRPPSGPLSRHISANVVVNVHDAESASGRCAMILYKSEPETTTPLAPEGISDFEFEFIKTDDGWKILRRYSKRQMSYKKET